jgi:hypothetical protein
MGNDKLIKKSFEYRSVIGESLPFRLFGSVKKDTADVLYEMVVKAIGTNTPIDYSDILAVTGTPVDADT